MTRKESWGVSIVGALGGVIVGGVLTGWWGAFPGAMFGIIGGGVATLGYKLIKKVRGQG